MFRIRLTRGQERLWYALVFLLRLLVLSIPLYIIIFFADLSLFQNAVAEQSGFLLRLMGFDVVQNGPVLTVGTANPFTFLITPDCTAWKSLLFFFALVFAVPRADWGKRLLGLVFGLPIIWVANLGRVVGTVLVEKLYSVEMAMLVHDYLWRTGLVVLVLVLWVAWMYYTRNGKWKWI